MKAVKLFGPGDMRLVDIDRPTPGPGEALVQVKATGVCASDVHYYREGRIGDAVVTEPIIMGHEFAGVVAELGPGVTGLNVGDPVAVEPAIPCGDCELCRAGEINICLSIKFCGTPPHDGSLREYIAWPAENCVPVPASWTMGEVAMLEPLAVGVYGVEMAEPVKGKSVAILGSGAIGLSILQAAKASGCGTVIVTDLIPERLEIARKLGADVVLNANAPDIVKQVVGDSMGMDIVFEAAGENDAVRQGTEIVRPGGLLVVGGIPQEDEMCVTASVIRRKGLTIKMIRRSRNTLHRSIELVKQGKVDLAPLVSHTFPVERVVDAFELAMAHKDGVLRAVVEFS
jgi:L-iditol 2-dehydrogenase